MCKVFVLFITTDLSVLSIALLVFMYQKIKIKSGKAQNLVAALKVEIWVKKNK